MVAAAAKLFQLCLTLCDPIDGSPPGSSVPGILQARILEWVAISFSLSGHYLSVYLADSKALVSSKHLTLLASSLKLSFSLPYITLFLSWFSFSRTALFKFVFSLLPQEGISKSFAICPPFLVFTCIKLAL